MYSFHLKGNLCIKVICRVRPSRIILDFNGIRSRTVVFIRFLDSDIRFLGTANCSMESSIGVDGTGVCCVSSGPRRDSCGCWGKMERMGFKLVRCWMVVFISLFVWISTRDSMFAIFCGVYNLRRIEFVLCYLSSVVAVERRGLVV